MNKTKVVSKDEKAKELKAYVMIDGQLKAIGKDKLQGLHPMTFNDANAVVVQHAMSSLLYGLDKSTILVPFGSDQGDNLRQTVKYSQYIDHLHELDDKELDRMTATLKRLAKKKQRV